MLKLQLFEIRAVPARPVRRVQLYVLQTHLPDFPNFPQRIQQIFCIWCTYRSILRLSRPPTNFTTRCFWRFYSCILARDIWGIAPKLAIEAPNAPFSRPRPKSCVFALKINVFGGPPAVPNSLQSRFRPLI